MKKENLEQAFEQLFQPMIEKCLAKALETNKEPLIKEPEQFLTIGKACKEFGCTQNMLRHAMNKQEIPYYSLESRTYLKRIEVHRYLESIRIKGKNDVDEYEFLNPK